MNNIGITRLTSQSLTKNDDMGVQTAGRALQTVGMGAAAFKVAQAATPYALKGVKVAVHTTKGATDVVITVGKATVTVKNTITIMRDNAIPLNRLSYNILRNQAAVTGLTQTRTIQTIIRGIQTAKPYAQKAANVAKGAADVVVTVGKATVTVKNTITIMRDNAIPLNRLSYNILRNQAAVTGLTQTRTIQTIVRGVQTAKQKVSDVKTATIKTAIAAEYAANHAYRIVRGVMTGSINPLILSRAAFSSLKRSAGAGAKVAGKAVVRGLSTGVVKGVPTLIRNVPRMARVTGRATMGLSGGIAGSLSKSDDMALQGVGHAMTLANYGVRTGNVTLKLTGKGIKTTAKTGVKTGKSVVRAVNYIRKKGVRAAAARARQKVGQALFKAGKSAVNMVMNLLTTAAKKLILPLILIIVVFCMANIVILGPVQAIGSMFGGIFSIFKTDDNGQDEYEDVDIRVFLRNDEYGVPFLRGEYIINLSDYVKNALIINGGSYHYSRLYLEGMDGIIDPSYAGIDACFYAVEPLANMIEPIFNSQLFLLYDMEPPEDAAKALLRDIFNELFSITEESIVEWCGQAIGEAPPASHQCGRIHAQGDCPNVDAGFHGSYTCPYCDSSYNVDGINYFHCYGYSYCGGHDVLVVTLKMDGIEKLLRLYFTDPISALEDMMPNLTEDQEDDLQMLKDYYEVCLEYIKMVEEEYGVVILPDP